MSEPCSIVGWKQMPDMADGGKHWRLFDSNGHNRADVWCGRTSPAVWHTWNCNGDGGENDEEIDGLNARLQALRAVQRYDRAHRRQNMSDSTIQFPVVDSVRLDPNKVEGVSTLRLTYFDSRAQEYRGLELTDNAANQLLSRLATQVEAMGGTSPSPVNQMGPADPAGLGLYGIESRDGDIMPANVVATDPCAAVAKYLQKFSAQYDGPPEGVLSSITKVKRIADVDSV